MYNEAPRLAACLRAIAQQTCRPYEVIVVDNNSTDNTVQIANSFPFVRLLHEPRQGVVHARTTGFDAANGDIIGRIDGDTVLSADWVESVQYLFAETDVDAVTGKMLYRDIAWRELVGRIDLGFRRHFARVLGREVALQGANMALRRTAWQTVRPQLCTRGGIHEDFDLAIHLNRAGLNVRFDESLVAEIGYRQAGCGYGGFMKYVLQSPHTYAVHGLKSRRHMYKVVVFLAVMYPAITLLYRGYSMQDERFALRNFLTPQAARVNPADFVE